jgi:hypothetical protein
MWTDRQWRDRRIGAREILWSWAIVASILLSLAAWSAVRALVLDAAMLVVAGAAA